MTEATQVDLAKIGTAASLLLVDDDRPFLTRLGRAMEARGFVVRMADTVADGIAEVKKQAPGYAVVDLRLADGNGHTHDQLPTLLAGRGGGFVTPGRHIIYQRETPVTNLFATMIERMGVRAEHVGDSTGRLAGLSLS